MDVNVAVAHDFTCPWCWIGYFQARELQSEFGVTIEWRGYELWPLELEWPEPTPPSPNSEPEKWPDKPTVPSRLELAAAAQGIEILKLQRPRRMRTNNAHQALEFAKEIGQGDAYCEALYRAYWERGEDINSLDTLRALAEGLLDTAEMSRAIEEVRFRDRVTGFDDPAYESGVFNVPTFFINGVRFAEQPYRVLAAAVRRAQSGE